MQLFTVWKHKHRPVPHGGFKKISCSVNRTEVYHWGSRLCSLIGASVLVAVTHLCMTKWTTYFYSMSRCTCVLVFFTSAADQSSWGPGAFVGQFNSEQTLQVHTNTHTHPHTSACYHCCCLYPWLVVTRLFCWRCRFDFWNKRSQFGRESANHSYFTK